VKSEKISNEFYKKLGTNGIAKLSSPKRDQAYISFLIKQLPQSGKVLDCACGYGRLTVPLAKKGYEISGIDLSPELIRDAKKNAQNNDATIEFTVGSMCTLPYKENSFAAVICMWTSFNHLLTEKEQLQALEEMLRVTKKNGIILIDLPKPKSASLKKIAALHHEQIGGVDYTAYLHNRKTITQLMNKLKIKTFSIKLHSIGGHKRLIVKIQKQAR
jgi:ubiquinone/menaquinone biosynthesis C-methylase UbiE